MKKDQKSGWLPKVSWGVVILLVALMVSLLVPRTPAQTASAVSRPAAQAYPTLEPLTVDLPEIKTAGIQAVSRQVLPHTIIPDRPRTNASRYTVQEGDSVFSIATEFKLQPESVLWANTETLNDDPQMLEVGLDLNIPPIDGVFYKWKEGDTVQGVADKYKVTPDVILGYPGNRLDMTDPKITPGDYIMIPGGRGQIQVWVVPTIPRGKAGVSLGFDTCDTSNSVGFGTGTFMWPAPNKMVSGNDYWSGHLAIDIGAGMGQYIYASDGGVVVYAGAISGGYGNMVMIDHGNGYQTLYAHLSQVNTRCGASVTQGQVIGLAGSSGNSTGAHLHFEVRYMGGFVNPWSVLP
ncbi:MAG TPA: M23 family metallopeptidase [Anaerolineaceae bacterium]